MSLLFALIAILFAICSFESAARAKPGVDPAVVPQSNRAPDHDAGELPASPPSPDSAADGTGNARASGRPIDEEDLPTSPEARHVAKLPDHAAAASPVPAAPAIIPESMQHHLDWLMVPIVTYDSDYKLGYGAAGQFQWAGEVDPYRYQLRFQVLFTTGGRQSHWIQYDSPRFLGTKLRFWANVGYSREGYAPYYGLGNMSSSQLRDQPELTNDHPFAYDQIMPNARVGIAYPLLKHLHAFFFSQYLNMQVNAPPGTLLAEQRPYGFQGGHELQFLGGIYWDTRDHEAVPSRGVLLEASLRGAARALGSSYDYAGINARALSFFSLVPRLVLALRLEGDLLTAGTPFYELSQFGGVDGIDGVGGEFSARGIPQDRYVGRGKVIGTVEFRLKVADATIHGQPLSFGTVAFTDLGRVWQFDGRDGPWYNIHAGYGGGLRVWRRSFVLRLDVASSVERPFNVYILFGHIF